ncbi:MAG: hypothetical protein IIB53_03515, partial [Planctomycetes bacterium]|nr:hypothetical protein [Planctomycetota bacterium]
MSIIKANASQLSYLNTSKKVNDRWYDRSNRSLDTQRTLASSQNKSSRKIVARIQNLITKSSSMGTITSFVVNPDERTSIRRFV